MKVIQKYITPIISYARTPKEEEKEPNNDFDPAVDREIKPQRNTHFEKDSLEEIHKLLINSG